MAGFKSRGVVTNSISIINNFILDTYSSGFSILQELIQNANDAKATQAIYSYLPNGVLGANHPLLKQPVLLAINDGPFQEKDAEAINQLGVGSKSKDSYSIGKFGLGMKSLYHLCDLIFYCTSDSVYSGAINPFADPYTGLDSKHPSWNYNTEEYGLHDMNLLINEVNKLYHGKKTAFCLAIPLRQDNGDEHIRQTFFSNLVNISELFSEDEKDKNKIQVNFINNLQNMCSILAFTSKTKSLKQVDFISSNEKIYSSIKDTRIETTVEGNDNAIITYFANKSIAITADEHNIAKILQESPSWPRSRLTTSDNDSISDKMDENDCSLIFLKRKHEGRKTLSILWSSYLPLKKKDQFVQIGLGEKAQYSYSLIFNGAFAIDSGRNGIMKYQDMIKSDFPSSINNLHDRVSKIDSQEEIMGLWNAFLFQKVLSPAVPSFLLACQKIPISNDDFNEILNCFKRESLIPFRDRSTEKEYIVYSWNENENKYDWQIERNNNVCILPEPNINLRKQTKFREFIDLFSTDSTLLLYDTQFAGLYNEKRLVDNLDSIFRDNAIMPYLQEEFIDLTFDDFFISFLSDLFEKLNINEDEATYYLDFLKRVLVFNYEKRKQNEKVPKTSVNFRNFINSMYARLARTNYKFYFIKNDKRINLEDVVKSWEVEDVPIIIFPAEYGIDSCINTIPDIAAESYISTVYTPILRAIGNDNAGALFSVLVENFFQTDEQKKNNIPLYFKYLPADLAIIPVTKRDISTGPNGEQTYISKKEGEGNLFKSVRFHENQQTFVFYEFAPDAPSCYDMSSSTAQTYGYNSLEEYTLMNLLTRYLSDYKYKGLINKEKADAIIDAICSKYGYDGLRELSNNNVCIYLSTNGELVCMSQDMGFDLYNFFPDSFKSDLSYRIVHLNNDKFKEYLLDNNNYKKFLITKDNVFDSYVKCVDKIDSNIIARLLEKGANLSYQKDIIRKRLKEQSWFYDEYTNKNYSCSQLVVSDEIPDEICRLLRQNCLLLTSEKIKNNSLLKDLDKNNLLVREMKELDPQIQVSILSSGFSLFGNEKNTANFYDLQDSYIRKFTTVLKRVPEYKILGLFIEYATKKLDVDDRADEFRRIGNLCRKNENPFDSILFNKVLLAISEEYADSVDVVRALYIFLFNCIGSFNPHIDVGIYENTPFPTMAGTLRALKYLCNPYVYNSSDTDYLIDKSIELKYFVIPDVVDEEQADISVDALLDMWKTVSKGLIALFLYITKQKQYRDKAFELMSQPCDNDRFFTQYLQAYKPTISSIYEKNYLTAENAVDAFRIESDPYAVQGRVVFSSVKDDKQAATTICGYKVQISSKSSEENKRAYCKLTASKKGNVYIVEVSLIPLNNLLRKDANELVINLIDDILYILFQRSSYQKTQLNFKTGLAGIIKSNHNSMDVARVNIRMQIDSIIKSIGIDKSTEEGKTINELRNAIDSEIQKKSQLETSSLNLEPVEVKKEKDKIDNQIENIKKKLVRDIEENPSFSQCVLNCIKNKLSNAQYDETNISFELFQNADDAMCQRAVYDKSDWIGCFEVSKIGNRIIYRHNGRPINKYIANLGHDEWNRDLLNMLSFSSDKNLSDDVLETGKHGYGFKSSYFISDNPLIYSGQEIAAEIVGGIIPRYIDEKTDIENDTVIELPLNKNGKEKVDDTMSLS